ncbi:hypothetical protein Bbelb_291840 [Branchiostoma belcheri]|nr:hypothetical protein Bbelb_291840 [Branchiostoma belcheri]
MAEVRNTSNWSSQETRCLIGFWSDDRLRAKMNSEKRKEAYDAIARGMRGEGYNRTTTCLRNQALLEPPCRGGVDNNANPSSQPPDPQNNVAPQGKQQDAPQGQQDAPQGQQAAPQGQQDAPQGQQDAPQGQQDAPQGQQDAPQGQQDAPQGQQDAPQGQHAALQGQQAAPQGRQAAPISSSKFAVTLTLHVHEITEEGRHHPAFAQLDSVLDCWSSGCSAASFVKHAPGRRTTQRRPPDHSTGVVNFNKDYHSQCRPKGTRDIGFFQSQKIQELSNSSLTRWPPSTAHQKTHRKSKVLVAKFKNAMADVSASQNMFSRLVQSYREEVLPDVMQNWSVLDGPTEMMMISMNDLYCNLHALI